MPCCTLIAVLLSQVGMAVGAIKVRLSGAASIGGLVPRSISRKLLKRPSMALTGAFAFEILMGAAAAPYLFTHSGRTAAAASFTTAWHICSVGALIAGDVAPAV